jgi:hypothetical protein
MNEPIHILSIGWGVQSTTLAMMSALGEIPASAIMGRTTPQPDFGIFADVKAEPESVYRWIEQMRPKLTFPYIEVSSGDLTETSTRIRKSSRSGEEYMSHLIPAYTLGKNGEKGSWFRQCTDKHKLTPLKKKIAELRGERDAVVWIGISKDEAIRMKPSRVSGVTHIWPLIEMGMSRRDCVQWMESKGFGKPPRSSCTFCPYHSDREWRRLRDEEPDAFRHAINYERNLQIAASKIKRLNAVPYLHNSRVLIDQVDFSTDIERGQMELFGNECEGMCGV